MLCHATYEVLKRGMKLIPNNDAQLLVEDRPELREGDQIDKDLKLPKWKPKRSSDEQQAIRDVIELDQLKEANKSKFLDPLVVLPAHQAAVSSFIEQLYPPLNAAFELERKEKMRQLADSEAQSKLELKSQALLAIQNISGAKLPEQNDHAPAGLLPNASVVSQELDAADAEAQGSEADEQ